MLALSSIACWCRLAQADLRFVTEGAAAQVFELGFDAAGTYQHLRIELRDPRNSGGYVRASVLGAGPGTAALRLQEDLAIQAASDIGVTQLLSSLYNSRPGSRLPDLDPASAAE